ncbi:hypothetical protein MMC08_002450 [Hypocenomyce scalaris]|nr:hypothetical protein [Hypocenomyce scalaris]
MPGTFGEDTLTPRAQSQPIPPPMDSPIPAQYSLLPELPIYPHLNLRTSPTSTGPAHPPGLHPSTTTTAAAPPVVSAASPLTHHPCRRPLPQSPPLPAHNLNLNPTTTTTTTTTRFYNDMGAAGQAVANARIKRNAVYHNLLRAEQDYYYAQMDWHRRVEGWIGWLVGGEGSVEG